MDILLYNILDCDSPMGMENGTIPDSALKASSEVSKLQYNRKPYHAVLYGSISHDAMAKSSKLCRIKDMPYHAIVHSTALMK